jgi:tRNA-Thr(GGU) m(6)t(6)A37 methyltransferase TsaA
MPIQPAGARDVEGRVRIDDCYAEGLRDLEGFSHVYLIYLFHKAKEMRLTVTPFLDTCTRGVFATRSPLRPNHIGLSIVELVRVEGNTLIIKGVDVLNETPLLDVKPYVENFDRVGQSRSGWMTASAEDVSAKRSDDRFT